MSTLSVPGTVLSSRGTGVNKAKPLSLRKSYSVGEDMQKVDKKNYILSGSSVSTMKTY